MCDFRHDEISKDDACKEEGTYSTIKYTGGCLFTMVDSPECYTLKNMRQIGLIDCNNFFVSCERLFRPDLQNRPVVVLSSNDGCVVARSQEIKDKGIPMGVPYFQIKDILSDMGATVFSSNFTLYRDISRRVFAVVEQELCSPIERYSIDECFFFTNLESVRVEAGRVRERVWREVGIPVSIGVGQSKTQAKFAAGRAKKIGGVCVFSHDVAKTDFMSTKLAEIWGVGRGRTRQFATYGLSTVGELVVLNERLLHSWFGVEGVRLRSELLGQSQTQMRLQLLPRLAKSHVSSQSFSEASTEKAVIRQAVLDHLQTVVLKLWSEDSVAATLRVFFYPSRFSDHLLHGVSVERELPLPTNDIFLLTRIANEVIEGYFKAGVPYKKAGVSVTTRPLASVTETLFPDPKVAIRTAVGEVVAGLNKKLGSEVVRLGLARSPLQTSWKARAALRSPQYTTDWRSIKTVYAKDNCS
jgi:DNA polymerase V